MWCGCREGGGGSALSGHCQRVWPPLSLPQLWRQRIVLVHQDGSRQGGNRGGAPRMAQRIALFGLRDVGRGIGLGAHRPGPHIGLGRE